MNYTRPVIVRYAPFGPRDELFGQPLARGHAASLERASRRLGSAATPPIGALADERALASRARHSRRLPKVYRRGGREFSYKFRGGLFIPGAPRAKLYPRELQPLNLLN